jgi:cell division protein FtsI (penicillin-binding protein 3)
VADFTVAGKTGTAQMVNPATGTYYQNRLVASFAGFLPADDPRLVILVVLYDVAHGHFGGLVAAPVFSSIAATAIRQLDLTPVRRAPTYDTASLLPSLDAPETDSDSPAINGGASDTGSNEEAATAESDSTGNGLEPAAGGTVPDFVGVSLRTALGIARAHGVTLEVRGDGYVIKQIPAAGLPFDGGPVSLILSNETGVDGRLFVPSVGEVRSGLRGHG